MKWKIAALAASVSLGLVSSLAAGATKEGTVVQLWPDGALDTSGGPEKVTVEPRKDGGQLTKVANVVKPTLTIFKPTEVADTGAAVIICPGGGYGILAYDLEGTEVAEWLNSIGATGIVLKYRVPKQRDAALADGQRAVSLVRSRAADWKIDPKRIGILGFSAGGHLAARASTNSKTRSYKAVDAADEASCRPDFAVLVYPAYLATEDGTAMDAATLPVSAETPPTFIAIAASDKFTVGALYYALALKNAKVGLELHVFQFGGHGCGLRKTDANVTTWPQVCERWLRGIKVLPQQ